MKKLIEKVRGRCTGLFIEADNDFNPCFGVDEDFQTSKQILLCSPGVNYSRFSLSYMGLPKPLKVWVSDPNSFYDIFGMEGLYVFHYPINKKRIRKELNRMQAVDQFFWERLKDLEPEKRGPCGPPIKPDEYYESIIRKYGDSSCIQMNLFNYVRLWGNKEIMQDVMDELKNGSETPFNFMRHLISDEHFAPIQEDMGRFRSVHFYDLMGKPKEVHYER